jgi:quercetin dioxygenase-like cupin family protein
MGGPMSVKSVRVTFTPGARTAWHTHPAGQVLYITSGRGWVQKEGEAPQAITTGDVVVFAPNEKHWHGAAADSPMTHIALQPIVDGIDSTWLEQVAPEHYPGA